MKINIKARLKNKAFLMSVTALVVSFVYQTLSLFGVVPRIGEAAIIETIGMLINILAFIGVLVDPTTDGLSDSERAMTYCTDCDVRLLEKEKENENENA